MKRFAGAATLTAFLFLTGCGGGNDAETPGAAAPDVSSETTPAPVPLPPETEPVNPDSGPAPVSPMTSDTVI